MVRDCWVLECDVGGGGRTEEEAFPDLEKLDGRQCSAGTKVGLEGREGFFAGCTFFGAILLAILSKAVAYSWMTGKIHVMQYTAAISPSKLRKPRGKHMNGYAKCDSYCITCLVLLKERCRT